MNLYVYGERIILTDVPKNSTKPKYVPLYIYNMQWNPSIPRFPGIAGQMLLQA